MKGAKLTVAILTPLAIFLGVVMAVFQFSDSWSQNHYTENDPFLYLTLFCISSTFICARFRHPDRYREVTKVGKISVRLEHLVTLTFFLFGVVITFGVNNNAIAITSFWLVPDITVSFLHLVFTGLAIGSGYIMLMTYPESKKGHTWALIGLCFGGLGFILAYVFSLYSIAWGEVLAAIPFAVFMYVTWIRK